jgi:thioredoxin reductase (NADPH)
LAADTVNRGKVVIIGAGPSGTAAAVQLERHGISPLLLDEKGEAGGLIENAHAIDNFPPLPAGLPGNSFVAMIRSKCRELDIEVTEASIEKITPEPDGRFSLIPRGCADIESDFDAVLVAAGTSPSKIEAEGAGELEGTRVFYEIVDLKKAGVPARTAIVGSGDAAFDYALGLVAHSDAEVRIFIRSEKEKCLPTLAASCRAARRIGIDYCHALSTVEESGSGIVLRFDSPSGPVEYLCDALLGAIGRRSNLHGLAPEIDLETISPSGATNIPGLFAAGDTRRGHARQLIIAMGDGTAAAMEIVRYLEGR